MAENRWEDVSDTVGKRQVISLSTALNLLIFLFYGIAGKIYDINHYVTNLCKDVSKLLAGTVSVYSFFFYLKRSKTFTKKLIGSSL